MKRLVLISLLVLLAACKQNTTNEKNESIIVDSSVVIDATEILNSEPVYSLQNMIDTIKMIFLQTNVNSVVSEIRKIISGKNYIYIIDAFEGGSVVIFDYEGNFIKRLPHGEAPHETLNASSMFYDKYNDCLYVEDEGMLKIVKYTSDGNYVNHYYTGTPMSDFCIKDSVCLFIHASFQDTTHQFTVLFSDTTFENITSFHLGEERKQYVKPLYLQTIDNKVLIYKDNEIYHYDNNAIKKKYVVESLIGFDVESCKDDIEVVKQMAQGDFLFQDFSIEASGYQFLPYIQVAPNELLSAPIILRNIRTGKMILLKHISNSIVDLFYIKNSDYSGKYFVAKLESNDLDKLNEDIKPDFRWDGSNPNNLISPEDMEKLRNVTPDDNPIIVLFKLKDEI